LTALCGDSQSDLVEVCKPAWINNHQFMRRDRGFLLLLHLMNEPAQIFFEPGMNESGLINTAPD
jgi:hypothetical protein